MPTPTPAQEHAIREQAYYFWEQDGRPDGRETEYWMKALAVLTKPKMKAKAAAKPKAAKAAKAAKVAVKLPAKAAASKTKAAPAKAAKPTKPSVKAKPKKA